MGINQFDDAASQLADAPNQFDEVVQARFGADGAKLRVAARQAETMTPESVVEAQRLASQLGLPVSVVGRNLEAMRRRAAAEDDTFVRLQRETPALAGWLQQPEHAALARGGERDTLARMERTLTFGTSILRGIDIAQSLAYGAIEAGGELVGADRVAALGRAGRERNLREAEQYGARKPLTALRGPWDLAQWVKETVGEQIPKMAPMMAGGVAGAAVGSVVPGVGTTLGGILGAFLPNLAMGVGEVQGQIKDIDPTAEAPAWAFVGGSAIAALDTALPGRLGGKLAATFGREAAEQIAKRALLAPVAPRFLRSVSGEAAKDLALEGVTEAVQEAIGAVAAANGTGEPVDWTEAWPTLVEAGAAGALLGGAAGAVAGVGDYRRARVRYAAAQQQKAFFEQLGGIAAESTTIQQLPEAAQAFLAQATKDGPVATVYAPVEAWTTYWQEKGIDPAQVAQEVTGDPDAYAEAVRTGEDLAIPTDAYAVRLAPTEHNAFFANELRLSPEQMNAREAAAFAAELDAEPEPVTAAPAAPVRQAILEQLVAAGTEANTAETYAALYEAAFQTLGERAGVDPVDLFARYGLQIQREGIDSAANPAQTPTSGRLPAVSKAAAAGRLEGADDTRAAGTRDNTGETGRAAVGRVEESTPPEPVWVERPGSRRGGYFKYESAREQRVRREQHYAAVWRTVLAGARDLDPAVDDSRLLAEFNDRIALAEDLASEYQASGQNPRRLLEAIAGYGGLSLDAERGGYAGELKWLRESPAMGPFGAYAGVRGVWQTRATDGAQATSGLSLDDMARMLSQDPEFQIDNIDDLLAALEDIARMGQDVDRKGAQRYPGTEELRRMAGINVGERWWEPRGYTEFDQSLLDQLQAAPGPNESRAVPFPVITYDLASQMYQATDWSQAAPVRVPVSSLVATQRTVSRTIAQQKADNPGDGLPMAMAYQGRYFLADGTHRAVAAWSRGDETIDVLAAPVQAERIGAVTYHQNGGDVELEQRKRGAIRFGADRHFSIALFEGADLSTFLHETGHFYLEVLADLADEIGGIDTAARTPQQQQLSRDYAAVLAWLGVEDRSTVGRAQHEQFARGFEAYLMEGAAPSETLRSVFARFRAWLVGIYRSVRGLNVDLTPDIRRVFDRLVASDEAIAAAEAEAQIEPLFVDAERAGMTPAQFEAYSSQVREASRAARETLQARVLRDLQREREAWWQAERETVKTAVTADLQARPVYQALAAIQRGTNPDGSFFVGEDGPAKLKIDKESLLALRLSADQMTRLRQRQLYVIDGGVPVSALAETFGYTSGDELVRDLLAAPPLAQAIEAETDARMKAVHGDILLDGTLAEAAEQAVMGAEREAVIREELRALNRARRQAAPAVAVAEAEGRAALEAEQRERAYERRWLEAEAKLRIAIAEGRKQAEIDRLQAEVSDLRTQARRGAATIRGAMPHPEVFPRLAAARVARMRPRDLQPTTYLMAARRASQAATDAAATQDFDGAIRAKQQELLNVALYREVSAARDQAERIAAHLRGLRKPTAQARLGKAGESYQEAVNDLIDRYEFMPVTNRQLDRRAALNAFVAAAEAEGLPVDIPQAVLQDARQVNWRELTLEELRGVDEAVRHIEHLARLKNRLLKAEGQRDLAEAAAAVAGSIRANRAPRARSLETRLPGSEAGRTLEGLFASHRKIASLAREMDGFADGGAVWEYIIRPLNAAGDTEAALNAEATQALAGIVRAAYPGKDTGRLYEKVYIPAINSSLSRMGRIMVALNWGNEGNRQRMRNGLLPGEPLSDAQVQAILDTLDATDAQFVQQVFDFINGYWDQIAAKQQRVTGLRPEKVEAAPFRIAGVDLRGGYFPLKYEDRKSAVAQMLGDLTEANLQKAAAYVNASTRRGHTEARAKQVTLPVRTDFGVIFEHVQQVIHDLAYHETLIDVNRVLSQPLVSAAIYDTYGDTVYKQLKGAIKDIAFGDVPAASYFERALNHLRQGATVAGLAWNVTTAALQPIGLTQSMVRIGPKWVARGVSRWLRSPSQMVETVRWIEGQSTFMRLRGQTQQREINEIRNQVGVNTGRLAGWVDEALRTTTLGRADRQAVADSFFWFIQQMQRVADVPTWLGAYEKAMDAGEPEERAIALADQAVLDAQGGGQIKDLAGIQRGGPLLKIWTNFYSFFNTTLQLSVESARRTNFKKPSEVGRLASDYVLLIVAPATLGMLVRDALRGGSDDEDLGEWVTRLAAENAAYVMGLFLGVRELSGAVQGYAGYEGPAGARGFSALARLVKQAEQGEFDAAAWKALNDSAGILFHYPAGQVRRTVEGVVALIEGKTRNPLALVSGPPKEAK